jgi:hypothetical protein
MPELTPMLCVGKERGRRGGGDVIGTGSRRTWRICNEKGVIQTMYMHNMMSHTYIAAIR